MDHDKLFRALEKGRAKSSDISDAKSKFDAIDLSKTSPETQTKPVLTKTPLRQSAITDLVPNSIADVSQADLSKLQNRFPMSVATMKKHEFIYAGMKNKAVLNAYRELRIKLKKKSGGGNVAVLISSVSREESSIKTAMNLAISYSLDLESSALVIDCNPHSNELEKLITGTVDKGITDYVDDSSIGLDKIIYPSGIDRVSIIPAGSNHERAVELFSSQMMDSLIYELKNRYSDRNIVVHAPPVLASSEARVLTEYCDLTVLTIPYGKTNTSDIEDAVNAIGSDNVAGVIYQH